MTIYGILCGLTDFTNNADFIKLKEDYSTIIDKKVAFNLNIIRKSILSILKIINIGKKYSLKNKIHYINDNFESFFPKLIEQLPSQASYEE